MNSLSPSTWNNIPLCITTAFQILIDEISLLKLSILKNEEEFKE